MDERQFDEAIAKVRASISGRLGPQRAVVGYSAPYAIYVHENLMAYHPVGQAKFLEQPTRTMQPEFRRIITERLLKGDTPSQALLAAGQALLAASLELCPIDTGLLRESGFVRLEQ